MKTEVQKRCLYDGTNVLEGIGLIEKVQEQNLLDVSTVFLLC